jgi:hypothetical protein
MTTTINGNPIRATAYQHTSMDDVVTHAVIFTTREFQDSQAAFHIVIPCDNMKHAKRVASAFNQNAKMPRST